MGINFLYTNSLDIEDDFKPHSDSDESDEGSSGVDEDEVTDDTASEPDSPVKVLWDKLYDRRSIDRNINTK